MSDPSNPSSASPIPEVIYNPPGLPAIAYRVGDYTAFRAALLQSQPGEVELAGWRPTEGDLGLQLLEWWAYLADILTFYNERIANASYLETAVLPAQPSSSTTSGTASSGAASPGAPLADPGDAQKIARAVGFRPTPGIAATGMLGVLVNALRPISIPAGFGVQNKPGPGQQPQVFEADASAATASYLPTNNGGAVPIDLHTTTMLGDALAADPADATQAKGLLLPGTITGVKPGDALIVAQPPSAVTAGQSRISVAITVTTVAPEPDPRGQVNTRIRPQLGLTSPFSPDAHVTDLVVLRSVQSIPVYLSSAYSPDSTTETAPSAVAVLAPSVSSAPPKGVHLASIVRAIGVGDLIVLEVPDANGGPSTFTSAVVTQYTETIWYANADSASYPDKPPHGSLTSPPTVTAIPIPHTFLALSVTPSDEVARVWYAYRNVGAPLDEYVTGIVPANAVGSSTGTLATATTPAVSPNYIVPAGTVATNAGFQNRTTVLLEGADGIGAVATLTAAPTQDLIQLSCSDTLSQLVLPLRVLFNVMNVTAGKTVSNEVLGSGDSTVAGQSFTLQKSPLTYLAGKQGSAPESTLQVFVDGTQWTEVQSFSGQGPNAMVFVTQEDASQDTTVLFGDGVNGARLPTGTGNVTATYRYGSGPGDPSLGGPAVGSLTTILSPQPGLQGIRNPVAMTGGAAPSTAAQIQASAPASALSFGRATSAADVQAIASQTPQVARVQVAYGWDPSALRATTRVYVDGGAGAVAAVTRGLAQASDPNVPLVVLAATEIPLSLALTVVYDPSYDKSALGAAVVSALTDTGAGPFAPSVLAVGAPLRASAIYAACRGVPGVLAIRDLTIENIANPASPVTLGGTTISPGEGSVFTLDASDVSPSMEAGDG